LNSPRLVADATGATVWRWDQQEPFGVNVPDENPSGLGVFEFPLRFPGQYADKETNLHYNATRDYDPGLGRYVESDLVGLEGGISTYAYVDSDPLTSDDPDGLQRRGGNPNAPYANQQIANVTANNLINQIQQLQPNFSYTYVTAPGQGGYTPAMIRSLQQTLLRVRQQSAQAPNFVVSTSGVCFPVPRGSGLIPVVNPGGAITGQAFSGGTGGGPGLSPLVTQLRLMNPTPTNPTGYAVYMNSQVPPQGVSPFTGQVLPNSSPQRHVPR
jgi:RHS repeat-associated protein